MFYFLKLTNRPIFKKKLSMNYFVSIKSEEASPGCTDIQAFYWASMRAPSPRCRVPLALKHSGLKLSNDHNKHPPSLPSRSPALYLELESANTWNKNETHLSLPFFCFTMQFISKPLYKLSGRLHSLTASECARAHSSGKRAWRRGNKSQCRSLLWVFMQLDITESDWLSMLSNYLCLACNRSLLLHVTVCLKFVK